MTYPLIENLLLRTAKHSDLDQLLELSSMTGSGMTSMPTDRQLWIDKLKRSVDDFHRETPKIEGDVYFLVLEDQNSGELVGSGALYAGIGLDKPIYSYKINTITATCDKPNTVVQRRILNLVNDYKGASEIGSLFLKPEYRRDGIGKFLSRARFLLLADFPERFTEKIFAELRGWVDENEHSPFWDNLGRKFFGLSFQKADFISAVDGTQFISDLMPKLPVYVDLLPQEAQDVIAKPHDNTVGALTILKKEGFRHQGYIDIFDAGPSIEVHIDDLKTVQNSVATTLKQTTKASTKELLSADQYIISNCKLRDYRMMRAPLFIHGDGGVILSADNATSLNIKVGDAVRIVET